MSKAGVPNLPRCQVVLPEWNTRLMRGQGQKARMAGVRDHAPESLVLQDREDAAFCRQSGASVGFQTEADRFSDAFERSHQGGHTAWPQVEHP